VMAKMIRADEVFDHVGYFSLDKLRRLIKRSGFKVLNAETFLAGLNNLLVAQKS
jgi:hypothetical protein